MAVETGFFTASGYNCAREDLCDQGHAVIQMLQGRSELATIIEFLEKDSKDNEYITCGEDALFAYDGARFTQATVEEIKLSEIPKKTGIALEEGLSVHPVVKFNGKRNKRDIKEDSCYVVCLKPVNPAKTNY
ncbi:MAG: hypothetical protein V1697_00070 [Candidatus Levyibacteriota bacterium]